MTINTSAVQTKQVHLLTADAELVLRQWITARTGIVLLDHQLTGLRDIVSAACTRFGYASAQQFVEAVSNTGTSGAEMDFLTAQVTVGESYFFRHTPQITLLKDVLLPDMLERKRQAGDRSLRVWSAGCSNGQEIYTLAIQLHQLLPDFDQWALHLLGTDINTDTLATAARGRYRAWSFRTVTTRQMSPYMTAVGDEYEVNRSLRKRVKFAYLNLADDAYPSHLTETDSLDLILCRNVLIYIDPEATGHILRRFANCLVDDGVLLLGPSDHVDWPADLFEHQPADGTFYLKKVPPHSAVPPPQVPPLAASRPLASHDNVSQITDAALSEAVNELASKPTQQTTPALIAPNGLEQVQDALRKERWQDALMAVEQCSRTGGLTAALLQARAKALACLGRLDAAHEACVQSLALDPADPHTYLMHGIVLMELGHAADAEAALRRALFLDHGLAQAHQQLGQLLVRQGRKAAGLKSLANARALATGASAPRGAVL